ncbi:class I SAM-dependent methyltransferase [Leptolyngbya sp. 7M]|uniref:class I SAM-dependent methyltransferase n=1 Tax=Leptolyngbya sp. 7M TaxID=2812896 RepID=UPI001B8DA195|nr:class I SAM-dependent methyltransferase [Leptolyngbya sp. 7M]QYO68367.1 class I SAM-dependent methyltransferase [Leptolyngbya sp. 7M]
MIAPLGIYLDNPTAASFFEMLEMPIFCNVLWPDRQAAQTCAKGDIKLAFDRQSGLIYNTAFDPDRLDYNPNYENSLDYSPRFQAYAQSLAERLIDRYQLHYKTVIEIGCGKGDFLFLLCRLGANRGIGFDPSYIPQRLPAALQGQVEVIRDFYSEQYADYQGDLIVCRHTLEHFQDPAAFLQMLRRSIGTRLDTCLFFEVPNAIDIFRRLAIWDILYEHCCYFSPIALRNYFSGCGFKVHRVTEDYQGQFLCLEATPAAQPCPPDSDSVEMQQLEQDVLTFADKFHHKLNTWRIKLTQIASQSQRAVVWGIGTKVV